MTDPIEESRIFANCYPALRRFAAVVGPDECDPDDLLQEAVARVLRHHRLDELDEPMAYLRRTIVNIASNERRRFAIGRRALSRLVPDGRVWDAAWSPDGTHQQGLAGELMCADLQQ